MVVRLASLFFLALVTVAQAKPLLVDDAQLAAFRTNAKAVTSLVKKCEKELAEPTHAVSDFAPAPHYTAEGANPDDDQAKGLTGDIRRAYRAALCYRLTGKVDYAAKTQAIATAWASTMASASNAQGRSDINFNIAQLIVAASWVDAVNNWNAAPFKQWLKITIAPLSLSSEPNNRGNWGNLLDVAIADYTDNRADLTLVVLRWESLISSEISDDGTLPLEICRSNSSNHCDGADKGVNGMAYTHFALLPATIAGALLADEGLVDFQAIAGLPYASHYKKALGKTAAFVQNPEQFPYYASNNGKLNKLDACSYFALSQHLSPNDTVKAVLDAGTCKADSWMFDSLFAQ